MTVEAWLAFAGSGVAALAAVIVALTNNARIAALKDEVEALRKEVAAVRDEKDEWKARFYLAVAFIRHLFGQDPEHPEPPEELRSYIDGGH